MYLLNIKIKFFIFLVFIYNLFEYIIQSLLLILSNLAFDRIYFFMHKEPLPSKFCPLPNPSFPTVRKCHDVVMGKDCTDVLFRKEKEK